jgi:hypothetical protein
MSLSSEHGDRVRTSGHLAKRSDAFLFGQNGVKVGGFRVPTQDVSGLFGSLRNDAMTVCAHGDWGATKCPMPGMLMIVAFDNRADAADAMGAGAARLHRLTLLSTGRTTLKMSSPPE